MTGGVKTEDSDGVGFSLDSVILGFFSELSYLTTHTLCRAETDWSMTAGWFRYLECNNQINLKETKRKTERKGMTLKYIGKE